MANRDTPFGLRLYEQSADGRSELVLFPASDGTAMARGDAVKIAGSSGSIGNGPKVKTVIVVGAGDAIYGVIQGFVPHEIAASSFSLDRTHRPASVAMYAIIRVANNADVYEAQASAAVADADIGLNANLSIVAANTTTGISASLVDVSSKNTTATLQVNILGHSPRLDNESNSASNKVLVRLNNIQVNGGTGTAGV
jgi:hypothetical protein